MQSASTVHFSAKLRLRVPQGLPEALQIAARQRHTTPAEWARQALLRSLEAQGVRLCEAQVTARPPQSKID
jgi:predicted HicB family RNase H-like nuclease